MDMLTSKNDAAIRAKMDEAAGDAAYHREGTHKVTGNYTFDSVYSVLQRNLGLGEGIQKFLDRTNTCRWVNQAAATKARRVVSWTPLLSQS